MRQCKCGGLIRQHELTGARDAWTCNACRRYSVIERPAPATNQDTATDADSDNKGAADGR